MSGSDIQHRTSNEQEELFKMGSGLTTLNLGKKQDMGEKIWKCNQSLNGKYYIGFKGISFKEMFFRPHVYPVGHKGQ